MVIKFLILLLRNLRLMLCPQRRTGIDRFFAGLAEIQHNRIIDMVGISTDNLPQINRVGKFFGVFFQKQLNGRAVTVALAYADFKTAAPVGNPNPGLILSGPAGCNLNFVRHHKRRIKTDAELTD